MMSVFYQEEPSNPRRRCKYLAASTIKQALSNCHSSRRNHSFSSPEPEEPVHDFDEEEEVTSRISIICITDHSSWKLNSRADFFFLSPVYGCMNSIQVFVSAVISKYMESRSRRKTTTGIEGFSWALSSTVEDLVIPPKEQSKNGEEKDELIASCLDVQVL